MDEYEVEKKKIQWTNKEECLFSFIFLFYFPESVYFFYGGDSELFNNAL